MHSPPGENQYIISPRSRRIINYLGSLFSEGECGSPGNGSAGDLHKDWNLPFVSIIFCLNPVKASIATVTLSTYPVLARAPTNKNRALAKG